MSYPTLMAHLELGRSNAGLLRIVGDLADRFHAAVVGIAACQPIKTVFGDDGFCFMSGDVVVAERTEIDQETAAAETEFRDAFEARTKLIEWRSAFTQGSLSGYLADQARRADLIITGVSPGSLLDSSRHTDIADLVMRAGRPVLIVPPNASKLRLERIVVAWKDTREARRAAFDALPLLKWANHVAVLEIAAKADIPAARDRLDDIVGWLRGHGVAATAVAATSDGSDAMQLNEIIQRQGADLIVAGAYGHNRMEEWALGGVTRDLLLCADRCALVSH
jgi:nucleotide-binding universal stress UspA family protein